MEKETRQNVKEKALAASAGTGSIPDKLYFKIGEVKKITGVEAHVLRYWESEFKIIRPQRASSKQRLYRKVDVENILAIKKLLLKLKTFITTKTKPLFQVISLLIIFK